MGHGDKISRFVLVLSFSSVTSSEKYLYYVTLLFYGEMR